MEVNRRGSKCAVLHGTAHRLVTTTLTKQDLALQENPRPFVSCVVFVVKGFQPI